MMFNFSSVSGFFLLIQSCAGLSPSDFSRRQLLQQTSEGLLLGFPIASTVWSSQPQAAVAAQVSTKMVSSDQTVLVLGANGQTGRECVAAVLASGRPCIATSRLGNFVDAESLASPKLTVGALDVTDNEGMQSVIRRTPNLGAVIFAASASTKGGNSFSVDRDGVAYAAQACIAAKVPRLVVVSSGTVTRPDSAVYKLLNTVGKGIMEAKIQGEDQVRALYGAPDVLLQDLGYTIIRPGGLTTGESLGAMALELNQGDSKSGRLARADVAQICVNALESADTWDTTFECYESLTAKPVESVGLSNILRLKGESTFVSGKERQGNTWSALFDGLDVDPGHATA
jgi:uncharacterized protein YbjT (DUF2867 family)